VVEWKRTTHRSIQRYINDDIDKENINDAVVQLLAAPTAADNHKSCCCHCQIQSLVCQPVCQPDCQSVFQSVSYETSNDVSVNKTCADNHNSLSTVRLLFISWTFNNSSPMTRVMMDVPSPIEQYNQHTTTILFLLSTNAPSKSLRVSPFVIHFGISKR
jgi:hypothetical protein